MCAGAATGAAFAVASMSQAKAPPAELHKRGGRRLLAA